MLVRDRYSLRMSERSEYLTRKEKIDPLLFEQGWDVSDRSLVRIEIDTKQSDFLLKDYRTVSDTLKNEEESKYADYILLDSAGAPLAVVEAKRTSKNALVGQKQAEEYAEDIRAQTGRHVFIFLTNGEKIKFWDQCRAGVRDVSGFYSRRDLERLRFQNEHLMLEVPVIVNTDIVDRARNIENVKRVVEHLLKGHRKALIVMATGTGKTRVAMGIIDLLMKMHLVQRVLFLADRKALRDQAMDKGYKTHFPEEARYTIKGTGYNPDARLYVSTLQTFIEKYQNRDERGRFLLSPGEFDLIFFDEAHRSIYNKWGDLFTYFDGIQIGLTATPSELVDRDTFQFFDCHDDTPTALYEYADAVRDGVLVDFRQSVISAQTHFQIEGVKPKDLSEGERDRLIAKGIDPDEIDFEGSDLEKKVAVLGTSIAIVREFMDNCQMDATGTLPAKSIFFAITKNHAFRIHEAFEKLYPEYKGQIAKVIVSEDQRSDTLIKQFSDQSMPRIAISVDMLDTGIDVPEVCNLVFAKPVFSKIKFWQMIGRGTRSEDACKHRDWLPEEGKKFFSIFDFWNNFEYFNMKPDGVETGPSTPMTGRIFLVRVQQLESHIRKKDEVRKDLIRELIEADITALPQDSVTVRAAKEQIEKVLSRWIWDNVGVDPIAYLKKEIMPLMRFATGVNLQISSFTLKYERLAYAVLKCNDTEIDRLKPEIGEMVARLPLTIDAVKAEENLIKRVLSPSFWVSPDYDEVRDMGHRLAPLMRYMQKDDSFEPIVIHMGDTVEKWKQMTISETEIPYEVHYLENVLGKIIALAGSVPAIGKIERGEEVSDADIMQIEAALDAAGIPVHVSFKGRVGDLIRTVLNQDRIRIETRFDMFIQEHQEQYTADQIAFIRMLKINFMKKRHIERGDLFEAPFTNLGLHAPVPMFSEEELEKLIGICEGLEIGV